MKKLLLLILSIPITVIIYIFLFLYSSPMSNDFEDCIISNIHKKNESIIDLKDELEFEWEKFYIFAPYKSKNEMYEEVDIKWNTVENMSEQFYKVVFVNKGKVICDDDISIGDFYIEADSYPVYSNNSKFKLDYNKNNFVVFKQISE
ncbi:hypothetical protein [Tepidibacter hydrothermalis]|uniref:Lipoprotein n=1 Tax=Tepidibacter hydrothermalis TaxID=3036126 RepID=A0ABY8ED89_9FIRM|nr:hypothetical protein [Tepidibacter hydrothermalis]WFD10741.1 hypothetical protein P4S50_01310 [Tepidibacter hydrothermalis]